MSHERKSLLVVINASPYRSLRARDALDLVLTAAAFEIPVSLLFCGDAVFQLIEQNPTAIEQKKIAATLPALALYDVERIYVEQEALAERAIEPDALIMPVIPVNHSEAAKLFHQHDQILSF